MRLGESAGYSGKSELKFPGVSTGTVQPFHKLIHGRIDLMGTTNGRSDLSIKLTAACLLTGTRYDPLMQMAKLVSLRLPSANTFEAYGDSVVLLTA